MNVLELYGLAEWYKYYHRQLKKLYGELHQALTNNAQQPTKVAIEPLLDPLIIYLREMKLGELSIQQIQLLEHLNVRDLIGPDGGAFVERTVKAADYDPAVTEQKIGAALQAINQANEKLNAYLNSIDQLGIATEDLDEEDGHVTVRVGFKNDAAIRNVKDWKTSAEDWYHIVRGLALVCGEAPEATKVVGASTGSVILILSATYAFSRLLATVSKHITGIARDVIEVRMALEDLRSKKLLNGAIEAQFKEIEQKKRDEGLATIRKELEAMLPKAPNGEQTTALEKAIAKLVSFGEDGGDIDFVAPPAAEEKEDQDGENEAAQDADMLLQIEDLRTLILSYQEERESVRLLSDQSKP